VIHRGEYAHRQQGAGPETNVTRDQILDPYVSGRHLGSVEESLKHRAVFAVETMARDTSLARRACVYHHGGPAEGETSAAKDPAADAGCIEQSKV
jgi:hypothetical protein